VPCRSSSPRLVALCWLLTCGAAAAQKPERPQEVRVPGIGVALKAGWHLFIEGGCRYAVPGPWQTTDDGGEAFSRDGDTLTVAAVKITNWSMHKADIRATFGHVRLHEDSEHRLWFEFGDTLHIEHYIEVPNGPSTCMGLLDIHGASSLTADDAHRIADSIGPAPSHWPPDRN
jgi:hypothetical protein